MAATPPHLPPTAVLLGHQSQAKPSTSLGRFKSAEAREVYTNRVKDVKRRTHSTKWSDFYQDDVDPLQYGTQLLDRIKQSLAQQNVQTARIRPSSFEWLLPTATCTPEKLAIYDRLYTEAPTVTNTQLKRIMRLESSTTLSPQLQSGVHYFYVRSFELTPSQLREVCDYMRESDEGYCEVDEWRVLLEMHEAHVDVFTLRYWGTVEGPRRPIDRHREDLMGSKLQSILGEFYRTLEALFPEILDNAEVHLILDASVDEEIEPLLRADDVERVLIEMSHPSSLLNRQLGGRYSPFLPNESDAELFTALKTDVWHRFRQQCAFPPDEMLDKLTEHFQDVQEYAVAYPQETGTARHDFTDSLKGMMEAQATPWQYKGKTLSVCVGKDITYTDYIAEKSYWDGGSRAGVLTKDILQRIVDEEAEANRRGGYAVNLRPQKSPWAFVDLWPWLWHRNIEQAVYLLRKYFTIVRPLIAVSFSRPVNGITRANFLHENGVRMDTFTPIVGEATIQFYSDPNGDGKDREHCAFINIGHIHHGRDKYGDQSKDLRRLLEATYHSTFLVKDIAMHVLDKHEKAGDLDSTANFELCREILRELKDLKTGSPYEQFYTNFDQVRRNCAAYFQRTSSRSSAEDVRPLLNGSGRLKLAALGQAEGAPHSNERWESLERIWHLNKPDLHLVIPHTTKNRDKWINSLMTLQTGQYLFLAVLGQVEVNEPDSYLQQLLSTFRPSGGEGRPDQGVEWLKDATQRGNAILKAGLWVQKEAQQQEDDVRRSRLRVHFPQAYQTAHDLQNSPIGIVSSSGIAQIRWHRGPNDDISVRASCKVAIPQSPMDTRVLHFTPEGLDILDASGKALRRKLAGGVESTASVPRGRFHDDPLLTELWQAVLNAHSIATPSNDDQAAVTRNWGAKGIPALTQKARKINPAQNLPVPAPEDANFILYEFVNHYFPNGGKFESITEMDMIGGPGHIERFREWIKRTEYHGHPYRTFWLENFDSDKPQTGLLAKNIPLYRFCTQEHKQVASRSRTYGKDTHNPGGKLYVQNTIFNIHGPGSAVDDIFDDKHGQSTISMRYQKQKEKKEDAKQKKQKTKKAEEEIGEASDEDSDATSTTTATKAERGKKGSRGGGRGQSLAAEGSKTTSRKKKKAQPVDEAAELRGASEVSQAAHKSSTSTEPKKRKAEDETGSGPSAQHKKVKPDDGYEPGGDEGGEEPGDEGSIGRQRRKPRRRNVRTGEAAFRTGEQ
ncbi:hypothetical protein KC316_g11648 [Hortaea werneckii]|nr:hypothetical protein KC324_g6818 [Hortaea werneckii]KAI7573956.1 hypothetical protein KC316_g11648 [Hortaea werneckii]